MFSNTHLLTLQLLEARHQIARDFQSLSEARARDFIELVRCKLENFTVSTNFRCYCCLFVCSGCGS